MRERAPPTSACSATRGSRQPLLSSESAWWLRRKALSQKAGDPTVSSAQPYRTSWIGLRAAHRSNGRNMRALILREPGVIGIGDVQAPAVHEGEVLLRIRMVGLCGSDLNSFRGKNP